MVSDPTARERPPKTYLGDGAYAEWDERGLVLTAENGIEVTDTVVLEPEVLVALIRYLSAAAPEVWAALKRYH